MEQRHLPKEENASSTKAPDSLLCRQSLTDEEEATTNALADSDTATDATTLTTLLQQEAQSRRKEELTTFAWAGAFLASMLWLASRPFLDVPSFFRTWMLCFGLIVAMGGGMCIQLCRRSYRRKRALTRALSQIHDKKQVGPLIQTLKLQNTAVRNLAKRALIEHLPTLQASDAPLLGVEERKILVRRLTISPNDIGYRDLTELFSGAAYGREIDFRVSLLKALQQVGGAYELAVVERLALGLPTPPGAARMPDEIREAAKECLPFLQNRANEQRASEQLLRASSVHATSDDVLLRPATTRADALPEQLLRASEPNL